MYSYINVLFYEFRPPSLTRKDTILTCSHMLRLIGFWWYITRLLLQYWKSEFFKSR